MLHPPIYNIKQIKITKKLSPYILWLPLIFINFYIIFNLNVDIENKASYQSMSAGVNYSSTKGEKSGSTGGFAPTIGLPQDKSKHSTTGASLGENTNLTITNQAAQTQN